MMRVSVVSEHRLPAELVALALRGESELEVGGIIGGAAALESPAGARALAAPVVLFAALAPAEVGLFRAVLQPARTGAAGRAVVVADLCGSVGLAAALQWGARGYVAAWEPMGVMAPRVRQVAQGRLAVPPGAPDTLRQALRVLVREATALQRLSELDLEVMRGVACGDSTKEIAARLNITEAALRGRVRRMITRLDVRNENELCAVAASAGLYEPRPPAALSRTAAPGETPSD